MESLLKGGREANRSARLDGRERESCDPCEREGEREEAVSNK
jgi:hypothetical protein